MTRTTKPAHFVVDGSNIATEGRSAPSLAQLDEAVRAFMEDHPGAIVTVVVDATFGHRISPKEQKAFDAAVANNEIVTPPAGAVGRGDAFVLTIADKAGAGVLSNDSFQEFHGKYPWLFEPGRLIGGKPVPHVGWVFVERTPVRGPRSRQATREAAKLPAPAEITTPPPGPAPAAEEPAPTEPAPAKPAPAKRSRSKSKPPEPPARPREPAEAAGRSGPSRDQVNSRLPFLEFVAQHPVGTSCTGVVESYASHGAYARVGDVLVYIPLRLMDSPPPRSARSMLKLGEAVTVVIVDYVGERLSIDGALPHMAAGALAKADAAEKADKATKAAEKADKSGTADKATKAAEKADKSGTADKATKAAEKADKSGTADKATTAAERSEQAEPEQVPPAAEPTKRARKATRAAAKPAEPAVATAPADEPAPDGGETAPPARRRGAKKAAATPPPEPPATEPAPASPAKKAAAKKAAAKKATAKEPPAKKAPAKKATAKQAPAKKAAAKKAAAKKAPAKKTAAQSSGEGT